MEGNSNTKNPEVIDLRVVARKIWDNRRLFYKVLPIVFVVSCIYIFSLPRYYRSDSKLAPEVENAGAGGALSSLASSFGFDLSEMQTTDAITPLLYPDLMEDNGFVAQLLGIRVKSQDGEIDATYHDYLQKYQKTAWWNYPINWLKSLLPKKEKADSAANSTYDPYNLSRKENGIYGLARIKTKIDIDKKTGVISIQVEDQDPRICRIMADSIQYKLQAYITNYRTNKARTDYEYYKALAADAKRDYEKVRQQYGSMSDANSKVALHSVQLKLEDMENEMQLKFNAYTSINTQLQAAKAKVQERTPAFTVIKGAAVPLRPAGPKRMFFVAAMLFLSAFVIGLYSIRSIIFKE